MHRSLISGRNSALSIQASRFALKIAHLVPEQNTWCRSGNRFLLYHPDGIVLELLYPRNPKNKQDKNHILQSCIEAAFPNLSGEIRNRQGIRSGSLQRVFGPGGHFNDHLDDLFALVRTWRSIAVHFDEPQTICSKTQQHGPIWI